MKPEQLMWKNLRDAMGRNWKADRVEPAFGSGIADVPFAARGIQGWIELKILPKWPSRANTVIQLPHPKRIKQQKLWLWERGEYGGHTWLLLKVQKEWLLFSHKQLYQIGKYDRKGLEACCTKVWIGTPPVDEFIATITK